MYYYYLPLKLIIKAMRTKHIKSGSLPHQELHEHGHDSPLPPWRLAIARIGLLAVTFQALLFVALWTPLVHYRVLLRQCVPFEFLLLLVAAPCVFFGKVQYRWWLLTGSVFLPVISFFVVLAEIAY